MPHSPPPPFGGKKKRVRKEGGALERGNMLGTNRRKVFNAAKHEALHRGGGRAVHTDAGKGLYRKARLIEPRIKAPISSIFGCSLLHCE